MTHLTSLDVSGAVTIGGVAISSKSGDIVLNTDLVDAGTASTSYVVCQHAGVITQLSAVNHVANTTTKTVYTAAINGVTVTHPAWETLVTAAAGTATSVVPTAARTVAAGDVISIASDGGSATANQKTTFSVKILRT